MVYSNYVPSKKLCEKTLLYCSQPLSEDERPVKRNQKDIYRLLCKFIELNKMYSLKVAKHPRDDGDFYSDEHLCSSRPELSLSKYSNWLGFNSMVLYAAKEINHKAFFFQSWEDRTDDEILAELSIFLEPFYPSTNS